MEAGDCMVVPDTVIDHLAWSLGDRDEPANKRNRWQNNSKAADYPDRRQGDQGYEQSQRTKKETTTCSHGSCQASAPTVRDAPVTTESAVLLIPGVRSARTPHHRRYEGHSRRRGSRARATRLGARKRDDAHSSKTTLTNHPVPPVVSAAAVGSTISTEMLAHQMHHLRRPLVM